MRVVIVRLLYDRIRRMRGMHPVLGSPATALAARAPLCPRGPRWAWPRLVEMIVTMMMMMMMTARIRI